METTPKIAVYMDHFTAKVIEYNTTATEIKIIHSDFSHFEKQKILQKGESHLHNKEQDAQQKFYKEIANYCANYRQLLLFGPTTAKTEFKTIISNDNRFSGIEIMVNNTDKLAPNQQIAFVNNYFYLD